MSSPALKSFNDPHSLEEKARSSQYGQQDPPQHGPCLCLQPQLPPSSLPCATLLKHRATSGLLIYHMLFHVATLLNMLFPWPEYPLPYLAVLIRQEWTRVPLLCEGGPHSCLITLTSDLLCVGTNVNNSHTHWNYRTTCLCPIQDKAHVFLIHLRADSRTMTSIQEAPIKVTE